MTRLEEMSANAWPAMQTMVYDGWILRFGKGYTRRANSISPLYPSKLDIAEKLERCEKLYTSMGLNTTFKLMDKGCPEELDLLLAGRGYKEDAYTSVRVMGLEKCSNDIPEGLLFYERLDDGWFRRLCRINDVSEKNAELLGGILSAIVPERYFAELVVDGKVIGCGVGVLEDSYIGLFDIVIAEEFRGQGYGRKLMEAMLSLGKNKGAQKAYLQVMLDNTPACSLYESLGFSEQYKYWYRVKRA